MYVVGCSWLPLTIALLLPLLFLSTYIWAVQEGHVEPDFPYISSTGAYPPESCLFSFGLNVTALLIGITVWLRHKQVLDYCNKTITSHRVPRLSSSSSWTGYTAALGIALVGNFQSSNIVVVHMMGAVMAFGVGTIYIWMQGVMSLYMKPNVNSRTVAAIRLFSAVLATVMCVTTIVFAKLHSDMTSHVVYWSDIRVWWREEQNGWGYHIASAVSEWVLAASFVIFIFTLVPEFKRVVVTSLSVEMERDRRQQRHDSFTRSTETVTENISRL